MNDIKQQIVHYIQCDVPIRKGDKRTSSLYTKILDATSFLTDAKIKERIYVLLNDITEQPKCYCGNHLAFLGPLKGYRQFCSAKCSANSKSTTDKRKSTCLQKYGVETPAQSEKIRNKMWETTQQKLGVKYSQQAQIVKNKTKNTNLLKYGSEHFTDSDTFKHKKSETLNRRYQGRSPKRHHFTEKTWEVINDPNKLKQLNEKMNLVEMAEELQISVGSLSKKFNDFDIPLIPHFNNSKPEKELQQFIKTLNLECSFNDRHIIPPKELDIVLTDLNIAIEFCGLYWHSDIHNRIDTNYHLYKLEQCNSVGIELLTFFEDEWYDKQDIIRNMLLYKTHKLNRIYARKCKVIEVSKQTKKDFYNKYHIQGDGRGSIHYGLVHNGDLVACMTFINHKNEKYELNRFASKNIIVGGFSKLLTHFKKNVNWNTIISYADRRFSSGNVYHTNGFKLTNISAPAYSYVVGKKRFHRKRFMKKYLNKLLPNYDPNLTENENINNNNIHRIWDCGQLRFELKNMD